MQCSKFTNYMISHKRDYDFVRLCNLLKYEVYDKRLSKTYFSNHIPYVKCLNEAVSISKNYPFNMYIINHLRTKIKHIAIFPRVEADSTNVVCVMNFSLSPTSSLHWHIYPCSPA